MFFSLVPFNKVPVWYIYLRHSYLCMGQNFKPLGNRTAGFCPCFHIPAPVWDPQLFISVFPFALALQPPGGGVFRTWPQEVIFKRRNFRLGHRTDLCKNVSLQRTMCLHAENVGVGQHQWYHFGVGAPPILVYFSGDWDVHWGYWILTHGHLRSFLSLRPMRMWLQVKYQGSRRL